MTTFPRPSSDFFPKGTENRSTIGLFALFFLSVIGAISQEPATLRPLPNIILMLADDMGMGDTSAYQDLTGNPDEVQVHTPNMERLARLGVRFADAHSPGSRCTPTRYSLLTGRYPWRSRLKWWVLFGAQGDPLIEPERPTIATLLKNSGYRTGMVGKWHVGLRYRKEDGSPAAAWEDASLQHPLHTSPLDHGFDYARFTSRSHGTSGPSGVAKNPARANGPNQQVGPGHIHGRHLVSASGRGRELITTGPNAYRLNELGSRHSNHAIEFLSQHQQGGSFANQPFFLYYPSNSNHAPYTPDKRIGNAQVKEAARTKSGNTMNARYDYIYENDVALGRLMDWLENTPDPRWRGHTLLENTLVIFSSDNGAEKNENIATGPFRSNKGSCYEGGHRVPLIAAWPAAGLRAGNTQSEMPIRFTPIGLQDLYATFAEIVGKPLPNLSEGERGAEDSVSFLHALKETASTRQLPLFFGDHKESTNDPAVLAMRVDNPIVNKQPIPGQWKVFFKASLTRFGNGAPFELYNLTTDPTESNNLIAATKHKGLVQHLTHLAHRHRNSAGHRYVPFTEPGQLLFDLSSDSLGLKSLKAQLAATPTTKIQLSVGDLKMTITSISTDTSLPAKGLELTNNGFGISQGSAKRIEAPYGLRLSFNHAILLESIGLLSEGGSCGGTVQVGTKPPLPAYCIDADNDSKTQHGNMSDLGILRPGDSVTILPEPHLDVESPGSWTLRSVSARSLRHK